MVVGYEHLCVEANRFRNKDIIKAWELQWNDVWLSCITISTYKFPVWYIQSLPKFTNEFPITYSHCWNLWTNSLYDTYSQYQICQRIPHMIHTVITQICQRIPYMIHTVITQIYQRIICMTQSLPNLPANVMYDT
jgi:hypothetical protein